MRNFTRALVILAVFLLLRWIVPVVFDHDDDRLQANVGQCLTDSTDPGKMVNVPCGDPTAAHKVVGRVELVSKSEFDGDRDVAQCEREFPTATRGVWRKVPDGVGYVLCLEPLTK